MTDPTTINVLLVIKGDTFSSSFLSCWTNLIQYFTANNIRFAYGTNDNNNALSLNKMLGGSTKNGKNQPLLEGKLKTEKVLIINSEVMFTPDDIKSLLESPKEITTGFCLGHEHVLASETMNESYFKNNGTYKLMTTSDLRDIVDTGEYELAYTALDFVCIKEEVFTKLEYPWFKNNPTKNGIGFYDHEVSFCKDVAKLDYTIWGDTTVIVGREKIAQIYDTEIFEKVAKKRAAEKEQNSDRLDTIDE